jgi:signal transduction histidine kinase
MSHDIAANPPRGRPPATQAATAIRPVDRQSDRIELLGTMTTGIAHEFNNLLTIVMGSLEQLHRNPLTPRGRSQLERAQWGVQQAGRLARQVLAFAGPERAEEQIVDLNQLVGEFDKMLEQMAGFGASLRLDLSPQVLPVRMNAAQMELALLNLVRNSATAMGGRGLITIRTAGHPLDGGGGESTVEVAVSDNGTGMTAAALQRANHPPDSRTAGDEVGLGLWMVKRFVAAYAGKVDIKTMLGKGTTVRLVFPRAIEPEPPGV